MFDKNSPSRIWRQDTSAFPTSPAIGAVAETLLLGRIADLDDLLLQDQRLGLFSDALRTGIEALRWFRSHYAETALTLSDQDRLTLAKSDADWTSHLLEMLRDDVSWNVGQGKLLS